MIVKTQARSAATPDYDVTVNGTAVGSVARTGSLPSCYRWWAYGASGERLGSSTRNRRDAVALVVESVQS